MPARTSSSPCSADFPRLGRGRPLRAALRAAVAAAVFASSAFLALPDARAQTVAAATPDPAAPAQPREAVPASARSQRDPRPEVTAIVEMQRQMNELRRDLLDEREKRIGRWQESNGTVLAVLGIAIGIGGLCAYAKFRAIAAQAGMGVAAARGHAFASWDRLPQPGPAAMRHDPDHPHAWLERADLKAKQGQYEGAIADYDRAIRLDPRNAGADLNRSLAKSELGRHDEAIADLGQAMRLDPDTTFAAGDE